MKRRLTMLLVSAMAISAVGIGTTLALFTAQTEAEKVNFTAGNLCLTADRNDGDPTPGPMFYVTAKQGETTESPKKIGKYPTHLWAPGDEHTRTLTVFNPRSCSTMDAWVTQVTAELKEGSDPTLADQLWVEVYTPRSMGRDTLVKVGEGLLGDVLRGDPIRLQYSDGDKIPLDLTSNRHMEFKVTFDKAAGNDYQGVDDPDDLEKSLIVHFWVHGEQVANNPR